MIEVRSANINDMSQIADVHKACFKGYFISLLGSKLISLYYQAFFIELPLFCVACEGDRIIGFCMGYNRFNTRAKKEFVSKHKFRLFFRVLLLMFSFNPIVYKKCFSYLFKNTTSNYQNVATGDLLSICVLDKYRGKGVAYNLLITFEKLLLDNNINDYTLGVYKDNRTAIRFYIKNGMSIVYEDEEEYKLYKHL